MAITNDGKLLSYQATAVLISISGRHICGSLRASSTTACSLASQAPFLPVHSFLLSTATHKELPQCLLEFPRILAGFSSMVFFKTSLVMSMADSSGTHSVFRIKLSMPLPLPCRGYAREGGIVCTCGK